MKFGILGTGMVGVAISSKLAQLGHEVKMGARVANNEKAVAWVAANGPLASQGTFRDAAAFGEMVINATSGGSSLEALATVGAENLAGKVLIDIANPMDFSNGMPPFLIPSLSGDTSVGEEIQKAYPEAKVVKTLNTMSASIMADASLVPGEHDVFISGNDDAAKATVKEILVSFGWTSPIDLGDISTARATEMLSIFNMYLYQVYGGSSYWNLKVAKA